MAERVGTRAIYLVIPPVIAKLTDMSTERSMKAREGRTKQLYEDGARVVAGGIVFNADKSKILMVSSQARPNHWVIPKGGAEKDESLTQSALREVWEEGGAIVDDDLKLVGAFFDERAPKHWDVKKDGPPPKRSKFYIYEMHLKSLEEKFPEEHLRKRSWMGYDDAVKALLAHDRVPLAEAVKACSLASQGKEDVSS